jgi:hypothetical protein
MRTSQSRETPNIHSAVGPPPRSTRRPAQRTGCPIAWFLTKTTSLWAEYHAAAYPDAGAPAAVHHAVDERVGPKPAAAIAAPPSGTTGIHADTLPFTRKGSSRSGDALSRIGLSEHSAASWQRAPHVPSSPSGFCSGVSAATFSACVVSSRWGRGSARRPRPGRGLDLVEGEMMVRAEPASRLVVRGFKEIGAPPDLVELRPSCPDYDPSRGAGALRRCRVPHRGGSCAHSPASASALGTTRGRRADRDRRRSSRRLGAVAARERRPAQLGEQPSHALQRRGPPAGRRAARGGGRRDPHRRHQRRRREGGAVQAQPAVRKAPAPRGEGGLDGSDGQPRPPT